MRVWPINSELKFEKPLTTPRPGPPDLSEGCQHRSHVCGFVRQIQVGERTDFSVSPIGEESFISEQVEVPPDPSGTSVFTPMFRVDHGSVRIQEPDVSPEGKVFRKEDVLRCHQDELAVVVRVRAVADPRVKSRIVKGAGVDFQSGGSLDKAVVPRGDVFPDFQCRGDPGPGRGKRESGKLMR